MSLILIVSIVIRILAMGWSIVLLKQIRDWRMGFLTVMLGLMAMRQTLTLLTEKESWMISITCHPTELPGLVVSVMALLAVFFLERIIVKHKPAEEALRESEERYRTLVEQASDGIFTTDAQGTYVDVNTSGCKMLGYSRQEILRMHIRDLIPKEDIAKMPLKLSELRAGKTVVSERRLKRKDGSLIPVEISAKMLTDGRLQGIARDISERKRVEKELQERREENIKLDVIAKERSELQEWINTFDTFVGKFDPNGVMIFCNEAPIKAGGLTQEEVFGKYFPDTKWWSHSEIERARIIEYFEKAKGGLASRIETNFRSSDGTPVPIIFNCQPVMDNHGKVKYITAEGKIITEETRLRTELQEAKEALEIRVRERTSELVETIKKLKNEIAERKRAEEALGESEERYRSLTNDVLDSSAVGIFILDSDFKVVWVNQSMERLFGLRRDDIIGKDKRLLIRERIKDIFEDPEGFTKKVLATYDNNTYIENFECHVLPDGERKERWLEHWSQPIRSGLYTGGRIEHYYDITERKRAEEALRERELLVQSLITHAPFSVWACNGEGTIIYANQASLNLFGVTDQAQIIGRYNVYRDITDAEKPFWAYFERAWAGEVVRYRQDLDMTTVKYGTSRKETLHFHTTLFAIPTVGQRPNIVVIQEDVTKKVQAEEHIKHLQTVLKAIRNINQLIVHEKNRNKLLQRVCEILNQTRNYKLVWIGLVQNGTKEILPAARADYEESYLKSIKITWDDSETGKGPTGTAIRTQKPFVMRDISGDPRYKPWREEAMKRGYASSLAVPLVYENRVFGALNVYATLADAFDEEEIGLLAEVGQDISFALYTIELEEERKRSEEKLHQYREQLRSLASELSLAEERERRRIAEDFHDRIAQTLAMSKIKLAELQEMATSTDFAQPLDKIQTMIDQAVKDARSLIFEISPPVLYELGFEAAVEWLTEHFTKQHGILFNFEDDKQDKPLDDHTRFFLFKAVQELLINIVKHAKAATARVCIRRNEENIEVVVEDDGRGFNVSKTEYRAGKTGGFGLFNIRERLDYHGGTLEIKSKPGHGTQVILHVPLKGFN